ncbi:hypothetical protein DQ04_16801000 [Trypanosoma grayi]|uniref:hypothetical protein n=1 Tax=Trypanosoma grayi TaxID=71804 RepID=UPI0004F4B826|nr:hypothetical protein DQ04_16801000 [Trypanosoma grayi]KEG05989.1 hypothetical protein DQ04_16801000 [Trypanosoma grayi]
MPSHSEEKGTMVQDPERCPLPCRSHPTHTQNIFYLNVGIVSQYIIHGSPAPEPCVSTHIRHVPLPNRAHTMWRPEEERAMAQMHFHWPHLLFSKRVLRLEAAHRLSLRHHTRPESMQTWTQGADNARKNYTGYCLSSN